LKGIYHWEDNCCIWRFVGINCWFYGRKLSSMALAIWRNIRPHNFSCVKNWLHECVHIQLQYYPNHARQSHFQKKIYNT
jgi:hypothetical protein